MNYSFHFAQADSHNKFISYQMNISERLVKNMVEANKKNTGIFYSIKYRVFLFITGVLLLAGISAGENPENKKSGEVNLMSQADRASEYKAGRHVMKFASAKPVWPEGRETERNLFVGFRVGFHSSGAKKVVLRITASSIYRAFINGEFCGYGPARGPHGWYRIDEWDLTEKIKPGENFIAVEVAGYNVNSYYLLDQPAFLEAEICADEKVLASTGDTSAGFIAFIIPERIQKVQRYSFQRPFCEMYRMNPDSGSWRSSLQAEINQVKIAIVSPKEHLDRVSPYPGFSVKQPLMLLSEGKAQTGVQSKNSWGDRSLHAAGGIVGGFPENELEVVLSKDAENIMTTNTATLNSAWSEKEKISFPGNSYKIIDFGKNQSGFIGADVVCTKPAVLYFLFDEILTNNDVNFLRLDTVSAIRYELQPGTYSLESFEPYTFRYLKIIAAGGDCGISNLHLREYANDDVWKAEFSTDDHNIVKLFEAARDTYRQNAVDVFTDCPSRERAGWLCDSFFTARTAFVLSGNTAIERNFLENYLLPDKFPNLPDGMIPMCYPADHKDGVFIPNWSLWFVLEVEEYLSRSGDAKMAEALKPRIKALFKFFEQYRNEDGLLEKLPSWVFVEWSDANNFLNDVNYPSNMLYAGAMSAAGRIYNDDKMLEEADRIREKIRRQSFNGVFFVDNAVRKEKTLEATQNISEVCQYYAFFFDVATPKTHPELWNKILNQFGPSCAEKKLFPQVHPCNAFIGNVLRLELLSKAGKNQQVIEEAAAYYLFMAEKTGTFWEHNKSTASCNHGFASHIAFLLQRDVLGIRKVDPVKKTVHIRIPEVKPEWCKGRFPVDGGFISLDWQKENGKIYYTADAPIGYEVIVENPAGPDVIKRK